jgi:hypothetical protein
MNKAARWIVLVSCVLGLSLILQAQDKIEVKNIEGVSHILNPAKPLKGTVQLEAEKVLTINPYDQPDVALKYYSVLRRVDGAVILYDPNGAEGHRFGPKGEYLGALAKKGQGPGEFSPQTGFTPFFQGDRIFVSGAMKLAEFDKDGKYLREQKLKDRPSVLIDDTHFLCDRMDWNKERTEMTKTLTLVRITKESLSDVRELDLLQKANIGQIMNKSGRGGLMDPWGTPNLCFAYDRAANKLYAAVNSEYRIYVKNMKGETLSVIEKAHENAKVSRKDVETMFGNMVKNDTFKWILDAYPDRLVAMNDIQPLANGWILVRRVSGPKETEIDAFDAEGKYIYVLKLPGGLSPERVKFHDRGYSTTETKDEFQIYVDYRIKNLPEVFGK